MHDLLNLHSDGVFLRKEAFLSGYDDDDLAIGVRTGLISRIRHGAYAGRSAWDAASETEKHRLRAHAVLRSHATPLALSHTSAAVEHGLALFRPDLARVHVTCLDRPLARTTRDVVYHCPSSTDGIRERGDGVLVVDAARAAVDAASLASVQSGLVVLDSALHLELATAEQLSERCRDRARWPGSRRLQISMRLARPGAESVGESLMRHLMWEQHLPEPELQFDVRDRSGLLVGRTDFAWPAYGLLGEFDGMAKYVDHLRPGETPRDAVRREKRREDRLREETGWPMVRFVWEDIFSPHRTAARIREQLARGSRRVG